MDAGSRAFSAGRALAKAADAPYVLSAEAEVSFAFKVCTTERSNASRLSPAAGPYPLRFRNRSDLERLSIALLQNEMPVPKPVRRLGVSLSGLQDAPQAEPQLVYRFEGRSTLLTAQAACWVH